MNLLTYTPIARDSDPNASHVAAERITASGMRAKQQRQVLEAIQLFPGSTAWELAEHIQARDGGNLYEIHGICHRRLPELCPEYVWHSRKERICKVKQTLAGTWHPVEQRKAA